MIENIKYDFKIIEFNCPVDGFHYRYTLHDGGWQWGRFTDKDKCEKLGREHFKRAIKFGNDWGVPMKELHTMKHLPKEIGDMM